MNDEQIIELYNKRDEAAIAETSHKYGKYLLTTAFNILRNHEDSEECLQDGYVKTWNAIPPAKPNSLKLFVAKIVRNTAIDKYISNTAEKRGGGEIALCLDELSEIVSSNSDAALGAASVSAIDFVDEQIDLTIVSETISKYLKTKDKLDAKIFVERYWYMHSVAKIASKYGVSQSKVKTTLFRERQELKDALSKEGINI